MNTEGFELYESDHGLHGFLTKSSQPQKKITRKYKKRPEMTTAWFSDRCGFQMPTQVAEDEDVWVHEFTENTLASLIKEHTGKSGLHWNFTRYFKNEDNTCSMVRPTVAHFCTSLDFVSGISHNERGLTYLWGDAYELRHMKHASSQVPEGCTFLIKWKDFKQRDWRKSQTFNSCDKATKNLIRRRVLELYNDGIYIGYFKRKYLPPVGICDVILAEFGVRIWTYTIERIIAKYAL